jgi:hypothetical protein
VKKHVRAVTVLHLISSIIAVIAAPVLTILAIVIVTSQKPDEAPLIISLVPILLLLSIMSIPHLIGAIGLLKWKSWGRILVIIYSCIYLIGFPIGTAIGVYSLWILLKKESVDLINNQNRQESQI